LFTLDTQTLQIVQINKVYGTQGACQKVSKSLSPYLTGYC